MRRFIMAISILNLTMASAFAQGPVPGRGLTAQDRAAIQSACRSDVQTHCSDVQPGGGRIMQCMRTKQDKLGENCRGALAKAGFRPQ
ncbi:MAG: cysteine rich repeat-containing protein [Beijerinckiaceae bacterium]